MNKNIIVKIPVNTESAYSLFAQGFKIEAPVLDKDEKFLEFKFLGGTCVCLFYTFAEFRRAYIVSTWSSESDGDKLFLPGIDIPLSLIYKAKGSKIDNLKHALYFLTKNNETKIFTYSINFWQKLSLFLQHKKIAKRDLIYFLKFYKNQEAKKNEYHKRIA